MLQSTVVDALQGEGGGKLTMLDVGCKMADV